MANTLNREGNTLEISDIDSDWTWSDTFLIAEFPNGIEVNFIQFNTAASTDVCIIKEVGATGPTLFKATANEVDAVDEARAYYYGARIKPFLDVGDGSYNASATIIIQLCQE
jgi:hypothetical protein